MLSTLSSEKTLNRWNEILSTPKRKTLNKNAAPWVPRIPAQKVFEKKVVSLLQETSLFLYSVKNTLNTQFFKKIMRMIYSEIKKIFPERND